MSTEQGNTKSSNVAGRPVVGPRSTKSRQQAAGQTEITSLDEGRKELEKRIWQRIPARLRLPLVALIVVGIALVSTRSTWYPWLFPAPHSAPFSGRIVSDLGQPVADCAVELLNAAGDAVAMRTSDGAGIVTFSPLSNAKISRIRIQIRDGSWLTNAFNLAAVQKTGAFRLNADKNRITYER